MNRCNHCPAFRVLYQCKLRRRWARATGNSLTITARSPKPPVSYTFAAHVDQAAGLDGAVSRFTVALTGGQPGTLGHRSRADTRPEPRRARLARRFLRGMPNPKSRGGRRQSMELVNPPEGFGAGVSGWTSRRDGRRLRIAQVDHCAFVEVVRDYHARAFENVAGLMAAPEFPPARKWASTCGGSSQTIAPLGRAEEWAFYHPEIKTAATTALRCPLYHLQSADRQSAGEYFSRCKFLRARLRDHVSAIIAQVKAAYPNASFELLFPYDVNHPQPAGVHQSGRSR